MLEREHGCESSMFRFPNEELRCTTFTVKFSPTDSCTPHPIRRLRRHLPRFAEKGGPSGMGVNRIELVFLRRPVTQSELYRHIVKPARREAAIEMPQSRNDHSDDRRLDVGTRLIEDEEIEARLLREGDAGRHLLARVEMAKLRAELRLDHRISARRQIGMVLQAQRSGAVKARFLPRSAAHETQG